MKNQWLKNIETNSGLAAEPYLKCDRTAKYAQRDSSFDVRQNYAPIVLTWECEWHDEMPILRDNWMELDAIWKAQAMQGSFQTPDMIAETLIAWR